MLDELARILSSAGDAPGSSVFNHPMSRADVMRRGLLGALGIGAAGGLAFVRDAGAAAAACPRGSLNACLGNNYLWYRTQLEDCDERTLAAKFGCYRDVHRQWRSWRRDCVRRCPPPKSGKPSPAKSRKNRSQPPELPPNPYEAGSDLCTACRQANGPRAVCCWGGRVVEPESGYCNCSPDNDKVPCTTVYGCAGP
jgi:hypothetical protein